MDTGSKCVSTRHINPQFKFPLSVSWEKGAALTKAPGLNWKGVITTEPSEEVQK